MTNTTAAVPTDVTFKYVPPDQLRFDPTNPRFAGNGEDLHQDAIQTLLEREPHLALELIPSMLENGFIDYEPLVVRAEADTYVVVEGNRRLAAIRHILARRPEYEAKSARIADLKRIPVLVFANRPSAQRDKEQRVYLGVRHLFGFREWPPESKARYLDSQVKTEADLERLARELNIKRQDIQRYLVPFRLRKEAKALWKEHSDQDFWVLGEGLSRAGIKAYIELGVDRKTLKVQSFNRAKFGKLLTFIYGTTSKGRNDRVVKETRQLSTLAKALQNRKATAMLEKGRSLAEATVQLETEAESSQRLEELLRETAAVLGRFKGRVGAATVVAAFQGFSKTAKEFLKNGR